MKTWFTVGLVGLALTVCSHAAQSSEQNPVTAQDGQEQTPLSDADRLAIRALVSAFADSWSKHDMDAMHALDAPDVEWINVVGNHWRGLANVRKGHTNYHHFLAAKSTSVVEDVTTRAIAPDVAIAVTTFHFEGVDPTGKAEDTRTRASAVIIKRGGSWKIVHFHNTVINPAMQGPNDPMNFNPATGLPRGAK